MNIFDQYLEKIKKILLDLSKNNNLILPDSLEGITAEIPPAKFNSDISTNVAMFLSKINNKSPSDLAEILCTDRGPRGLAAHKISAKSDDILLTKILIQKF